MMEAHKRFRFGPGDLVIPMWSSITREDRYFDNAWQTFMLEGNDNHPFPLRHLEYLRTIYKHISISPEVESAVEDEQQLWASRSVTYDSSSKHRVGVRTQFNHF